MRCTFSPTYPWFAKSLVIKISTADPTVAICHKLTLTPSGANGLTILVKIELQCLELHGGNPRNIGIGCIIYKLDSEVYKRIAKFIGPATSNITKLEAPNVL